MLEGQSFKLKLIDFGVAQCFSNEIDDTTDRRVGTVAYHPPELFEGKVYLSNQTMKRIMHTQQIYGPLALFFIA